MTMREAINCCQPDELYGGPDARIPMLLIAEHDDHIRLWVVLPETEDQRCSLFYLAQGRSYEETVDQYSRVDRDSMSLSMLHESCTGSNNWQVLSLEELAEINHRSFDEIPHR